jgi:hypothetical protein
MSLDVQLDIMLAQLVTYGVRRPLQVVNFGFVVDDTGGRAGAWTSAITAANGQGAGPAHAHGQQWCTPGPCPRPAARR